MSVSRLILVVLLLLAAASAGLSAVEPLRVAHTGSYAPYEFTGPDGRPQGYLIDVFRLWSEKTGHEIELVRLPWSECLRQLQAGEVDVITAMTPTAERRVHYAFAREIARAESRVFTHRSLRPPQALDDLAGLLVGVVEGDNAQNQLVRRVPAAHLETYPGYRELTAAALAEEVHVLVGTSAVIYHHLTDLGGLGSYQISDFTINRDPMAPAVRRDRRELVQLLDAGLAGISDQEWEQLARLWVPYTLEPGRLPWSTVVRWAGVAGSAVILLLLAMTLWSHQMRRRVAAAVAAREQMEEQLRHRHKMEAIGQLAGGVAHDFNNVLMAILGHAELIGLNHDDPVQVARSVAAITNSAERAAGVVRQLLSFGRPEHAQLGPVDLHQLVHETVLMLESSVGRQVHLVVDLRAPRHVVEGDADLLQAALVNLVVNARDAMPTGGVVSIATGLRRIEDPLPAGLLPPPDPGDYCVLSVSDTGGGIRPDLRTRIFEPFFTTKEVGAGTGLGLAAVYGTVYGHGGAIEVDDSPSGGAEFRLWLPLADAPSA